MSSKSAPKRSLDQVEQELAKLLDEYTNQHGCPSSKWTSDDGEQYVDNFSHWVEKQNSELWAEANLLINDDEDPFSGVVQDFINEASTDESSSADESIDLTDDPNYPKVVEALKRYVAASGQPMPEQSKRGGVPKRFWEYLHSKEKAVWNEIGRASDLVAWAVACYK